MSEIARKLGLDKNPLNTLVENAHKEISALCHGKQWRMCIPAQADDSDIVISEALQAQDKEIERLLNLIGQMGNVAEIARVNYEKRIDHFEHVVDVYWGYLDNTMRESAMRELIPPGAKNE